MPGLTGDQLAYYERDMYVAKMDAFAEEGTVFDKIYKVIDDNEGLGNKETQMLGAGQFKQHSTENEDIDFKTPIQGWTTYTAYKEFSDGLKFSKVAIERTIKSKISNMLNKLAATWGFSERVEKETYAASAFNNGGTLAGNAIFNGSFPGETDSSGALLYDGVPLFALSGNNHVTKGGGTGYYNSIASLTLNAANFETVYNLHVATNNVDERNRKIRNPVDTLLTSTGADELMAKRILMTTQGLPGGQLNDLNVYNSELRGNITPIAWDYLTDSAFYVGKKQSDEVCFVNAQSAQIRFSRDETNLAYQASIHMMFSVWFKAGCWKRWTRGGGSAA